MKDKFNYYLNNNIKFDLSVFIGIILLIVVLSGITGWIYEVIFYYFNNGMITFYMRGANFLPFINIYSYGALMILFLSYRFRKNPYLVFIISFISTGILEYVTGFVMDKYFNLRCWDYSTEILSYFNINGYVCLRSTLIFGVMGLILIYLLVPIVFYMAKKCNKKVFITITYLIGFIFLFDEFYNLLFARILNFPRARDIYTNLGIKYMNYRK